MRASYLAASISLVLAMQATHAQDDACSSPGAMACYTTTADNDRQPATKDPLDKQAAIDAAYQFLYAQMDMYHRSTIVYAEPTYGAFYPSGWMGATKALTVDAADTSVHHCGKTSLRISYQPNAQATPGWAGVAFQYPRDNWNKERGRDLSGAKTLTFWARSNRKTQVEFTAFKVHAFSNLDENWKPFSVEIGENPLRWVVNPLSMVIAAGAAGSSGEPVDIYLDDIVIDRASVEEPRFIQSYLPKCYPTRSAPNTAHVYDQALVLLAFLARGKDEDLRRAELIAQALVTAQKHDRFFKDDRLRNAYASGELVDQATKVTRLPGQYVEEKRDYVEDAFAAGSDTGNLTWAGLALVQAHTLLSPRDKNPYLTAAKALGEWIVRNQAHDKLQGFSAGFDGFEKTSANPAGQSTLTYRSTEHNLDLFAFFTHLAAAEGHDSQAGRRWLQMRDHARVFVEAMQNGDAANPHLWTGTISGSDRINGKVIPLDPQAWSVLAVDKERYKPALVWALANCGAGKGDAGFDFNCKDGDGAWFEGTAQVASALRWTGQRDKADPLLVRLRQAQVRALEARGAVPAASKDGVTTGFDKFGKPWVYDNQPHIGATAWYLFAELGKNPFYLAGH